MKTKNRKRSQIITGALLVLAVAALLFGGIGGARSVLTPSETYTADIATQNADLAIYEAFDGGAAKKIADGGSLLADMPAGIHVGQLYQEEITVMNTGNIDQYVRASVYQYWTDADGKKVDLDPALIKLTFGSDWEVAEKASSTHERTVLYYTKKLPAGEMSSAVVTEIGLDPKLATTAEQKETKVDGGVNITTTYKYGNGDLQFNLEVSVDGIQDHNAKDAAISAWGVDASQYIPGM